MMFTETNAIVLGVRKTNQRGIFVVLLTEDQGKLVAVANGAKNIKSPLAPCARTFVHGRFMIHHKKNVPTITSCEILSSNYRLADCYEGLMYASYFNEICMNIVQENNDEEAYYQLMCHVYQQLLVSDCPYDLLRATYLVKVLKITGYLPDFTDAIEKNERVFFSDQEGLNASRGIEVSNQWLRLQQFLAYHTWEHILQTAVHDALIRKTIALMESFLFVNNGIKVPRSRSFLL